MDRVSIVIPCYNPGLFLLEAVASARSQKGCIAEVILVNDGTDSPESHVIINRCRALVDQYIEQPNRGLAAARNTGFRAANCEFVIPLDADDLLDPGFAATCLPYLKSEPLVAFAYTDYRLFGTENYVTRLKDYNLYALLDQNVLTYAAVIRRSHWEECCGYDESMSNGYEDWEFWLRLGEREHFGRHVSGVLFHYRKHGPSLLDSARKHHSELVEHIRQAHPWLYGTEGRARIKRRWAPAVCIVAAEEEIGRQTIRDWTTDAPADNDCAFLLMGSSQHLREDSAELSALAVWGGRQRLELPDGSIALSSKAFLRRPSAIAGPKESQPNIALPKPLERLNRHLSNAGILSLRAWTRHPLQSASRLIPLRFKETLNELSRRRLFDLSFYMKFRPASLCVAGAIHQPLCYIPEPPSRRRIGFVTPHLGLGGAETVLLDIAASLDREQYELFLLATESQNNVWRDRWEKVVDHVYDLQTLVGFSNAGAAIYSIATNWELEALLVQNSLIGYSILPQLKSRLPALRTMDLVHSVDKDWDLAAVTRVVDACLDIRIAISDLVRARLLRHGTPDSKIRLIRNGLDLQRFGPSRAGAGAGGQKILFAGRLDAVKRPLLLPDIAEELLRLRGQKDFRFVIAGDGPERDSLMARVRKRRLESLFDFRGYVQDIAPLLADCEVVILPSSAEGIPMIILEAFAAGRTVVASAVGAVPEVVTSETGVLIPHGPGEIQGFANALHELLAQPKVRQVKADNGRRLVEQLYNRQRFTEEYRALFA
jgi:glycosyltransferase involved in cell wall biosynthesis